MCLNTCTKWAIFRVRENSHWVLFSDLGRNFRVLAFFSFSFLNMDAMEKCGNSKSYVATLKEVKRKKKVKY